MTQSLHDYAAKQFDGFSDEYGCDDRDRGIARWTRHLVNVSGVPDHILEAMPEVSRHDEPQVSPQEYECGCVAVTRITDRDCRIRGEKPFEMRLALPCDGAACELASLRAVDGRVASPAGETCRG